MFACGAFAVLHNFRFILSVLCLAFILQHYRSLVLTVNAYGNTGTEYQQQQQHYPNSYQQQYQQQHHQQYPNQQEPPRSTRGYSNSQQQPNNVNRLPPGGNYHQNQDSSQLHHQQQQQQQQQNTRVGLTRSNYSVSDRQHNKCKIWVPAETVDKYSWASKIQMDEFKKLHLIEVCCPGYGPVRWRGNTVCRPICENCQNGLCYAPGQCRCYEEFVSNDNGDCVFTCPLGCLNGRCYLDGSCQCDAGYKLDESRKFCRPICSAGCGLNPRHNCTEPEVCGCAKGYQLTDEGCQPTCQPDCGVGGYCREFNVCECGPGYNLKDNVCQSDCYQKCDNGICYGRNRCICNAGFTYHEHSTKCIPL